MNAVTKKFSLATILTITTSRFLCSFDELYGILGFMTDSEPMTHQLPRVGDECRPYLFEWFPELVAASNDTGSLDGLLEADTTREKKQAIATFLSQLQTKYPDLKSEYTVDRIPEHAHVERNPIEELEEMVGPEKVVVVQTS